jgi:polyisoprenoid-binding protein YceI
MKKILSIFACSLILLSFNFATGSHNHNLVKYNKYVVDPTHTNVGFSIRHMVISNVKGNFTKFKGLLKVDKKNNLHSFDLTMKSASVNTANINRDKHLRSKDFFDVKKYPEIKFRSTKIIALGGNEYNVIGDFTMKSITKLVTLTFKLNGPIKDPWGNTRIGASIETKVNRKDFGLSFHKIMEAGGLLVADQVKIEIELESIYTK